MLTCNVMNKSIKVVGDRVSELRKALGYSQSEFAMALNNRFGASVKQSAISHIEAGRKQPSIELLGGMAIVLETTADYLLGLSDNEKRPGNHSQGDEITLTVEDEKRRGELYEMAIILKAMLRARSDHTTGHSAQGSAAKKERMLLAGLALGCLHRRWIPRSGPYYQHGSACR